MGNLSRSVVLNILGLNKQAKDSIAEVDKAADELTAHPRVLNIGGEGKGAFDTMGKIRAALGDIADKAHTVKIGGDGKEAIFTVAEVKAALDKLNKDDTTVTLKANGKDVVLTVEEVKAALGELTNTPHDIKLGLDDPAVLARIQGIKAALKDISGNIHFNDITGQIDDVVTKMEALNHLIVKPDIELDPAKVTAEISVIRHAIDSIKGRTVSLGLNAGPLGLGAVDKAFKELENTANHAFVGIKNSASNNVVPAMNNTRGSILSSLAAMSTMNSMVTMGTGRWGLFGAKIQLFGGILTRIGVPAMFATVGIIHVLIDAIIEIAAVLIPASIAFGAFAIAAGQGIQQITSRLKAMQTVSSATGHSVGILSGAFQKVENAVQPTVMQLFGDALLTINNHTGLFSKLAQGAASVLSNLGARFVNAMNSSNGFTGQIARGAVPALAHIGQLIANVGGVIGNVIKQVPGYASVLLQIAVGVTGFVEKLSGMVGWLIKAGLAFHGFLIYVGLAATATVVLARSMAGGLLASAGNLVVTIISLSRSMISMVRSVGLAKAAMEAFDGTLVTNPLFWVAAAIAGIAALTVWLARGKTQAQGFVDAMEKGITNLSAGNAINKINTDILSLSEHIKFSEAQVKTFSKGVDTVTGSMSRWGGTTLATQRNLSTAQDAVKTYRGAIVNLTGTQNKILKVTGDLIKQGFSYSQALGIMNLAGVKAGDTFAVMKTKVQGLIAGYAAMGVKAGVLRSAVNAVDLQMQQQQSKVQQLTGAYSNFINLVTGSQNAFVQFAQGLPKVAGGIQTVGNAANKGRASMNGLNAASLTLRSNFNSSVQSATSLYNALVTQAAASGHSARSARLLTEAGKEMVGTLLAQARGSKQATAQLYALAQLAGFKGPDSFKKLSEWVGNTHNAEGRLNAITGKLTISSANLSKDVKNLANSLQQSLNSAMSAAIFQAEGGQRAFNKFATAVVNAHQRIDPQLTGATHNLIKELIATTGSTRQAHDEFITFATALGLNRSKADQLWNSYQHGHDTTAKLNDIFHTFTGTMDHTHATASSFKSEVEDLDSRLFKAGATTQQVADYNRRLLTPGLEGSRSKAAALANAAEDAARKLNGIPKDIKGTFTETGKGVFTTKVTGVLAGMNTQTAKFFGNSTPGNRPGTGPSHHAKGTLVPGHGNEDNYPALLTPGEAVVPKHLVPHVAPFLAAHHVPGFSGFSAPAGMPHKFAAGGLVGGQFSSLPQTAQFASDSAVNFAAASSAAFVMQIIEGLNAIHDAQAAGGGGTQGMKNPYRKIKGLTPERIDMGVDFGGTGPIFAIGPGVIGSTNNAGWPGGTFIEERLTGTPYAGKFVYQAENITPRVRRGQKVDTNTVIGEMHGGIEAGWSAGTGGTTMAAKTGQQAHGVDPGGHPTWFGKNFDELLVALGVPKAPNFGNSPVGKAFPGFYSKSAGGLSGKVGSEKGDIRVIFNFLTSHGFGKTAALGVLGNMGQESRWNPESVGSGGGGLIGFTPLPHGYVTGNASRDMLVQLNAVLGRTRQYLHSLNRMKTIAAAVTYFMDTVERPGIPALSNRIHDAFIAKAAVGMRAGGIINEPIFGMGLHSGTRYAFGETGPEIVSPMSHPAQAGQGGNIVINIDARGNLMTDKMAIGKEIDTVMSKYVRGRGRQRPNFIREINGL